MTQLKINSSMYHTSSFTDVSLFRVLYVKMIYKKLWEWNPGESCRCWANENARRWSQIQNRHIVPSYIHSQQRMAATWAWPLHLQRWSSMPKTCNERPLSRNLWESSKMLKLPGKAKNEMIKIKLVQKIWYNFQRAGTYCEGRNIL